MAKEKDTKVETSKSSSKASRTSRSSKKNLNSDVEAASVKSTKDSVVDSKEVKSKVTKKTTTSSKNSDKKVNTSSKDSKSVNKKSTVKTNTENDDKRKLSDTNKESGEDSKRKVSTRSLKKEKDNVDKKQEVKSVNNKKSFSKSVVKDIAEDELDKTGAMAKVKDSSYVSGILNNKLINSHKASKNKGNKNTELFDGKFNLDILDLLIMIVITAIISCVFTGIVINYQYKKDGNYVDSSIAKDQGVKDFLSLYAEILANYYEDVDKEAMIKAGMKGMLSFLEDTYSIYMSDEESDNLTEMLDSSYDGIGIVIQLNKIVSIYKNSPASNAGLKVGDEIISINGNEVNAQNYANISEFLKKDESNKIIALRDGENLTFDVEMSKVNIPTATSTMIQSKGKNIGFIQLSSFSNLSYEDFNECLIELEKENMNSLIIDLRGNSGGYLKAAYDIASEFIEKDKVIYSLEQKGKVTEYKDETKNKKEYDVIVLVNNGTASASEILAAALHDSYGAKIVGKTTYGKGKVQTLKQFEDATVKYTSAKWLRPTGECIDGIGIEPDYEVEIQTDGLHVYDKQLDKAIELLSED